MLHDDVGSHARDRNLQAGPVMLAAVNFTRCVWSKLTKRHMHMDLLMQVQGIIDATGKPLIREEFTDYADSAQLVSSHVPCIHVGTCTWVV